MKKFYLISFDISSDKKRRRVVKALENSGRRVQRSVFECLLTDKEYVVLKKKLDESIDMKTDSIRYYFLCKNCIDMIEISGKGYISIDEDLIVI